MMYYLRLIALTLIIATTKLTLIASDASPDNLETIVFETNLQDFSYFSYKNSVKKILEAYEGKLGKRLTPGEVGKVGLKVYTASGLGLSTPVSLVRALVYELGQRGYGREDIFIVDQWESRLRAAGYLPPLSRGGASFEGVQVKCLQKRNHLSKAWYYGSALPAADAYLWESFNEGLNKSFLAYPLLDFNVDFWINLPCVTSHPSVGLIGALANSTLLNITHNGRFLNNQEHASMAVAEIAAIPELRESLEFTILSLENYQFVGGFLFNSNYTESEPRLLLSKNMGAIDNHMFERVEDLRQRYRIPRWEVVPTYFKYCKQLGVCDYTQSEWVKVD